MKAHTNLKEKEKMIDLNDDVNYDDNDIDGSSDNNYDMGPSTIQPITCSFLMKRMTI